MTVLGPNDPRAVGRDGQPLILSGSRFSILKSGVTIATGAYNEVANAIPDTKEFQKTLQGLLARHVCGDWGEVDAHDARQNDLSVKSGARIVSSFTVKGIELWVISDAAWTNAVGLREVTTILRPCDY